jgi:hypothetical protein
MITLHGLFPANENSAQKFQEVSNCSEYCFKMYMYNLANCETLYGWKILE